MLDEIVNVTITRETTAVSRAGFGTMLIAGPSAVFTDRTQIFTSAASMLTAGFEATDPEYLAAAAAFSQNPNVTQIKIGRFQVDQLGFSIDTVVDSTDYTVTINGTEFTYNSGVGATNLSIAAGLEAAINLGSEPVTATDDLDGTITLDADVAGTAFSFLIAGSNMGYEKPFTAADTVANDLAAIKAADNDWYALVLTSRTQADVEAAALFIESEEKIFITASSDANIYDSGSTTDIAAVLKTAAYDQTAVIFSGTPTQYADAAWLGKQLTTDPGSSTWAFKTLSTISADSLTPTQSTNIRNKKANTYESIGGVNITREGQMASGEYIDVIRGVHWLKARLQENVYSRIANLPKIPFTDGGIAIVESEIRSVLQEAIANGLLTEGYSISVPLAANVSATDKANRLLPDITFEATLAGAVHSVTINGVVSL